MLVSLLAPCLSSMVSSKSIKPAFPSVWYHRSFKLRLWLHFRALPQVSLSCQVVCILSVRILFQSCGLALKFIYGLQTMHGWFVQWWFVILTSNHSVCPVPGSHFGSVDTWMTKVVPVNSSGRSGWRIFIFVPNTVLACILNCGIRLALHFLVENNLKSLSYWLGASLDAPLMWMCIRGCCIAIALWWANQACNHAPSLEREDHYMVGQRVF